MTENRHTSSGALPDFLYIGVARAGSTWLFEALRAHPEIYVPPAKDLYFFDRYYENGIEWYQRFFENGGMATVKGELSHDYYVSRNAADRIRRDIPNVKLVCCLREPVECLVSGYRYNRTMDLGEEVSLAEYARRGHVLHQFDYYGNLRYYYDIFDASQLLVVFYDDLQRDPAAFAREIYRFLGVAPDFVAPTLHERVNPAREARNEHAAQFVYRVSLVLRKVGLANLVGRVKRSRLVNRLLYQPQAPAERETAGVPQDVVDRFRENYGALEAMIGRPLPETWYG